ncbi:MAG: hypothetical protein K0R81_3308 [Microbacterium sp.]|nr:hypothetical protein [Microbacterium sp.]
MGAVPLDSLRPSPAAGEDAARARSDTARAPRPPGSPRDRRSRGRGDPSDRLAAGRVRRRRRVLRAVRLPRHRHPAARPAVHRNGAPPPFLRPSRASAAPRRAARSRRGRGDGVPRLPRGAGRGSPGRRPRRGGTRLELAVRPRGPRLLLQRRRVPAPALLVSVGRGAVLARLAGDRAPRRSAPPRPRPSRERGPRSGRCGRGARRRGIRDRRVGPDTERSVGRLLLDLHTRGGARCRRRPGQPRTRPGSPSRGVSDRLGVDRGGCRGGRFRARRSRRTVPRTVGGDAGRRSGARDRRRDRGRPSESAPLRADQPAGRGGGRRLARPARAKAPHLPTRARVRPTDDTGDHRRGRTAVRPGLATGRVGSRAAVLPGLAARRRAAGRLDRAVPGRRDRDSAPRTGRIALTRGNTRAHGIRPTS